MTKSISVLLVDDHTMIRAGLATLLGEEEDICVIAEAGSGREAIEKARELHPDVLVMDLTMPDMGGVQAMRHILAEFPESNILVLSMLLDETCVVESLDAGARGYLAKDCAADELVTAIRAVHAGEPYFCSSAQEVMMKRCLSEKNEKSVTLTRLSKRETEVLTLTASGMSIKEIAYELGVSSKMIEVHRTNMRKKLGLYSIAELTSYALKTGLIND